ncbi:substrate-binding periplasmic protein [Undibacterium sp. RuRC25W]|uniref:substrate-binding periplasmic protein n=1 Tax=Undibacterium sp. RuRC25W TaxID=3413047 RepID=UPI003BF1B4F5
MFSIEIGSSFSYYKRAILMLCLSFWCAVTYAAETTLTMIIGSESPPKMFLNTEGKPDGYFAVIAAEAARRAGYKINVVAGPWTRAVQMAERGEGVVCGLSYLPEREKVFKYSLPVVVDKVLIVTMKKRNLIASSLADLKGLVVGVNRGSRYGEKFVNELPLVVIDEDSNAKSRLKKLAFGRIDAAVMPGGRPAVRLNAQLADIDMNDLSIQKTPVALDPNHFAIAHSYPDANRIIERLNNALNSMTADGSLNKILDTWGG